MISQVLEVPEPSAGNVASPEPASSAPQESQKMTKNTETSEVDSSYYSVNKFNFLFYLMYKLKYSEEKNEPIIIE